MYRFPQDVFLHPTALMVNFECNFAYDFKKHGDANRQSHDPLLKTTS